MKITFDQVKHLYAFRPILRPLSDITQEEENEIQQEFGSGPETPPYLTDALRTGKVFLYNVHRSPLLFFYLIERRFDLFGLIESGEAVNYNEYKALKQ